MEEKGDKIEKTGEECKVGRGIKRVTGRRALKNNEVAKKECRTWENHGRIGMDDGTPSKSRVLCTYFYKYDMKRISTEATSYT